LLAIRDAAVVLAPHNFGGVSIQVRADDVAFIPDLAAT
jgi:hypothetical protein